MVISRVGKEDEVGQQIVRQLFASPRVFAVRPRSCCCSV